MLQIGRSYFLNKSLEVCYDIDMVYSFRELSQSVVDLSDAIILIPSKKNADLQRLDGINFKKKKVILISSLAVGVKGFSSEKFQRYRSAKINIENIIAKEVKELCILRYGMFVWWRLPKSYLYVVMAFLLSFFVSDKERGFYFTTPSSLNYCPCFSIKKDKKSFCMYSKIKGKGWFSPNFKIKRIIVKFFVKIDNG
jgi:hypothetical protein